MANPEQRDITSHNLWHDVDQRFLIFNSCFLLLGHDNDHIDDNHCHQLLMKPRWSHVAQRHPTSNLSFSPRSTRTSCPTRPHSVISPSATTARVPSARWALWIWCTFWSNNSTQSWSSAPLGLYGPPTGPPYHGWLQRRPVYCEKIIKHCSFFTNNFVWILNHYHMSHNPHSEQILLQV